MSQEFWDSPAAAEACRRIESRPFSEIPDEVVSWLWPGVVPYGKLTLFVGDPGHGKSLLSLELAARLSTGTPLPDETRPVPADSLLVFCEDGAADTVKPRLHAAGADLGRIQHLRITDGDTEGMLTLPNDLGLVEKAVHDATARLIVLDPVNAFLSSKTNSWKDADIRRALAPLALLAQRTACAVVGVMHLNKAPSSNAIHRVTGSVAYAGLARSVFLVGPHPDDKDLEPREQRRVFAPVKMNLAEMPSARTFTIANADGRPRVVWGDSAAVTANGMLASQLGGSGMEEYMEQAKSFLREILSSGPRPGNEVFELARRRDIPRRRVKRAARALRVGMSPLTSGGEWYWRLPDSERVTPVGATAEGHAA